LDRDHWHQCGIGVEVIDVVEVIDYVD